MLDVIIPCGAGDVGMLPLSVLGARKNVADGVGKVFVVGPWCQCIVDMCSLLGCEYVDERDFMGFGPEVLDLPEHAKGRENWIYQQLIKLRGYALTTTDNYLVLDSDHVLLQRHHFTCLGGYLFYVSAEHHLPYFWAIDRLLDGVERQRDFSFISDKMVMNKAFVREMLDEIELKHEIRWEEAICMCCDDEPNGFSEYETYGNWLVARHNELDIYPIHDYRYLARREEKIRECSYDELVRRYGDYKSVTELKF